MRHAEMPKDNSIHVVVNPNAGGKRAGQHIEAIRREFIQKFNSEPTIHVTGRTGDGFRIGDQLRQTDARLVVAVGGDGTVHEVVNGLFRNGADISTKHEIGVLDLGSGGSFAQGLGLPKSLSSQIALLAESASINVDLGLIQYENADGQRQQRLFVNEFQLGVGAKVVEETGATLKALGGTLAYALTTIRRGLVYRGPELTVSLADGTEFSDRFLGVLIGNGPFCGGGMRLAPRAQMNDGKLDLLLMHKMSVPERLLNFTRVYSGKHIQSKLFTTATSISFHVTSSEVVLAELDGEVYHLRNCTVEVLPAALAVKVLP